MKPFEANSLPSSSSTQQPDVVNRRRRNSNRNIWDDVYSTSTQPAEEVVTYPVNQEEFSRNLQGNFVMLVDILHDEDHWHLLQESMRKGEYGVGCTNMSIRENITSLLRHHYLLTSDEEGVWTK
jgi:hypothetical protein